MSEYLLLYYVSDRYNSFEFFNPIILIRVIRSFSCYQCLLDFSQYNIVLYVRDRYLFRESVDFKTLVLYDRSAFPVICTLIIFKTLSETLLNFFCIYLIMVVDSDFFRPDDPVEVSVTKLSRLCNLLTSSNYDILRLNQ